MFQIQSCCGNAKGQRDRLLAGMKAATCWSGQQGIRLQSRAGGERTERKRKRGRKVEGKWLAEKRINFRNNHSIRGGSFCICL